MKKLRAILLVAVVGIITVGLAACGQSSSKKSNSSERQTLNLSTTAPLDTIDVSKSTGYGQTGNTFESFYRLGKNGQPTAGLARVQKKV